eukprot:m.28354 g.28354  ORF g.28354 m.28354 type:complete len:73 (-) comp7996_c0_seq1:185-403(-)
MVPDIRESAAQIDDNVVHDCEIARFDLVGHRQKSPSQGSNPWQHQNIRNIVAMNDYMTNKLSNYFNKRHPKI